MADIRKTIEAMGKIEGDLASRRTKLADVTGSPRVVALTRMQEEHRQRLATLTALFWAENQTDRAALLSTYLSALITFKLVGDDIYIEAVEEAIEPKNKADKPVDKRPIDTLYRETIEDWIVGSPLLETLSYKSNRTYIPTVRNPRRLPAMRNLGAAFDSADKLRTRAKEAVQADLLRIIGNPKADLLLSASTDHLLGVLFLIKQLELHLRAENDSPPQSEVDDWYEAASRPVKVMAEEVLGVFDDAVRTAIGAGNEELTARLVTARHLMLDALATRYSLRRLETRVLLSFFEKQNKEGQFADQRIAFGVNRVQETLFSYVARLNADNQENRTLRSVDAARAQEKELAGKTVDVYGLLNASETKLTDERTNATVNVRGQDKFLPSSAPVVDRRVIVKGKLTGSGKTLTIEVESFQSHSEGYRALVGFPLLFAQRDPTGKFLEQQPPFRRTTAALQRAGKTEQREAEEGVFSVAQTLAGQRELVTDLLRNAEIRKTTFATSLAKAKGLDLQNTETRVKAWSILFKELVTRGNRNAMHVIGGYLGSYFAHHTRHTYYNIRDKGKSYLDSPWPTDLLNRKLHDCGVYAVQAAYDLYRAVAGTPGITLEFRFVTFLNHICLVVFFDNAVFLVNNATVHAPRSFTHGTPTEIEKVAAAFEWAERGFTSVYDVTYAMFLAVVPQRSFNTKHSDADFKKAIFKLYLDSQGWGIKNDATVAGEYFQGIELFDNGSKKLVGMLPGLKSGKASADDWNAATTVALDLYKLAAAMSDFDNFKRFNPDFEKHQPRAAIGFAGVVLEKGEPRTLPMYEVSKLLADRKQRGVSLTPDQNTLAGKLRGRAHADDLTDRLNQAVPANP